MAGGFATDSTPELVAASPQSYWFEGSSVQAADGTAEMQVRHLGKLARATPSSAEKQAEKALARGQAISNSGITVLSKCSMVSVLQPANTSSAPRDRRERLGTRLTRLEPFGSYRAAVLTGDMGVTPRWSQSNRPWECEA
jgi:hypothetical protein